ncbi:MAG: hypothetical protein A2W85_09340 [Bacteroidetes bacterium GWF2_41_31]|nr:MAG: hypothetical protein A2W85_09340 [Bacteroidetes bacterium GWF2_41_31]
MKTVEISQSGEMLTAAYEELMEKISEHVTVLAMHDEPIDGIMTTKRGLYRLKEQLERLQNRPGQEIMTRRSEEILGLSQSLMWLIEETQQKLGIDVLESVKIGMVGEDDLKRVLIQYEYLELAKEGYKYKDIKQLLSCRYDWSVSRIEKLVYRG